MLIAVNHSRKKHLGIYKRRDIKLLIDFDDAYDNQGTFSFVHEGHKGEESQ